MISSSAQANGRPAGQLQCGDPTGTGSGGPAYRYGEENLPKAGSGKQTAEYAKGTLVMANAGSGTNGSQLFMVYGDSELPPNYTLRRDHQQHGHPGGGGAGRNGQR